ncbi:MAG: aldehyde dehydrogenase family protein [Acidobacteriota bacterium]|nr:aldehyde dehydrogenase family protein [Acidobacteriota bacterium]
MSFSDTARIRMEKARSAQNDWIALAFDQRRRALRGLRHTIASHIDDIVRVVSEETGKPPLDALAGDVMVTLEQMRFYERTAQRTLRPRAAGKPWFFFTNTRFAELREPYGVALILAPWNYPFQLAVVPMVTALFAGNAVVLKCSERTPRTAALIAELCGEAGLPPDLVQVCCEPPAEAAALVEAQPDLLFFTGSSRNGRVVAEQAARHLIPAVLELGGKDPCLVFASCNVARAVEAAVYGAFSNAGQVCVGTRRIYVEQSIYDDFVERFLARVAALRIGSTLESDLGPIRFDFVRDLLAAQVDDAVARGAKLHTEWTRRDDGVPPLVLTGVPPEAQLLTDESFGPVVCLAPFRDQAHAIELANSTPFALSASIFTADLPQGQRIASQLNCGSCAINDVIRNIGNPQASFGGNGASGNGRYHGAAGLRTFSRIKSVMTAAQTRRRPIHWFPFTARTFQRLRGLLLFRHTSGSLGKRIRNLLPLLLTLAALVPCGFGQQAAPSALSIDVAIPPGVHGDAIGYLLFSSSEGFPGSVDRAYRHSFVPLPATPDSHQQIKLYDVPPGRYAVAVYLDVNSNRKLDKNLLGIPREPVGVSNNPKPHMGPPRFSECVFTHGPQAQVISVQLIK